MRVFSVIRVAGSLVLALLAACDRPGERAEDAAAANKRAGIVVHDDSGHRLALSGPADRIVSLVPAVTEILFALGQGHRLVGRTDYGVHPPAAANVPSVGDGVDPDPERILAANPDLVVLYSGVENRRVLDRLRSLDVPVLAVEHDELDDLYRNIQRLGSLSGARARADSLVAAIAGQLEATATAARAEGSPIDVYFDLGGPTAYTIGRGSYLDTLIHIAGGRNVFHGVGQPSARVNLESVITRAPSCVLVGARDRRSALEQLRARPGWSSLRPVALDRVAAVDADLVYRLGPRVGDAAVAIRRALRSCRDQPERATG